MPRTEVSQGSRWLFQERMSNTAYQRAMADMKAAGLNRCWLFSGRSVFSAGAGATMQATNMGDSLQQGVTSALDSTRLRKDIQQADAGIAQTKSQESLNKANEKLVKLSGQQKVAETLATMNSAENARLNNERLRVQMPALAKQAEADLKNATYNTKYADFDNMNSRVAAGLNSASSALNMLRVPVPKFPDGRYKAPDGHGKGGFFIKDPGFRDRVFESMK